MSTDDSIPYGYCHCGCGEKTRRAPQAIKAAGLVKGEPYRYIQGHSLRSSKPEYVVEDRGYDTPCWTWQRHTMKNGYGQRGANGAVVLAHRFAYEQAKGPIPEGLHLDHLCRNRNCVNPDHLEPVTQTVNTQRGANAKLRPGQVRIIYRRKGGDFAVARQLANTFGVSVTTVYNIWAGRTWSSVTEEKAA